MATHESADDPMDGTGEFPPEILETKLAAHKEKLAAADPLKTLPVDPQKNDAQPMIPGNSIKEKLASVYDKPKSPQPKAETPPPPKAETPPPPPKPKSPPKAEAGKNLPLGNNGGVLVREPAGQQKTAPPPPPPPPAPKAKTPKPPLNRPTDPPPRDTADKGISDDLVNAVSEPIIDKRKVHNTHWIKDTDLEGILNKCRLLDESGYNLYGLFGRPATGKSSMVYALRQHFKRGSAGFGGFTVEGEHWEYLAKDLEQQWEVNRPEGSKRGFHIYQALHPKGKNHMALIDVAGEHFENVKSWTSEIFDFFGLYFKRCKGYFVLVELDDQVVETAGAAGRKGEQLERIVSFLSIAGSIEKIENKADLESKKAALQDAIQNVGKYPLKIPVALCLTKADRVPDMNFGSTYGKIVPGHGDLLGDPWNAARAFWREHVETLLDLVPHLKIEWVSCLGPDFERDRKFSQSLGLRTAFEHVVADPPPRWSLSTKQYFKWRKFLRI